MPSTDKTLHARETAAEVIRSLDEEMSQNRGKQALDLRSLPRGPGLVGEVAYILQTERLSEEETQVIKKLLLELPKYVPAEKVELIESSNGTHPKAQEWLAEIQQSQQHVLQWFDEHTIRKASDLLDAPVCLGSGRARTLRETAESWNSHKEHQIPGFIAVMVWPFGAIVAFFFNPTGLTLLTLGVLWFASGALSIPLVRLSRYLEPVEEGTARFKLFVASVFVLPFVTPILIALLLRLLGI